MSRVASATRPFAGGPREVTSAAIFRSEVTQSG